MFGMSSKEFWEDDPNLYWAYRTFYLKKLEIEQKRELEVIKYESWLCGNMTYMATSTALNNAFSKQTKNFPSFEEIFGNEEEETKKVKTKKEIEFEVQAEFNAWAR